MKKLIKMMVSLGLTLGILAGCASSQAVLTIDGHQATLGEATLVLRQLEAMYETYYGEEIWQAGSEGETYSDIAKEAAMDSLSKLYVSSVVAEEKGIALSDEDLETVQQLVDEYMTFTSEEALEEDGISLSDVEHVFELNLIGEKLMDVQFADFEVDEETLNHNLATDESYQQIQEYGYEGVLEQVTAQHILFSTLHTDGTAMSPEEVEAVREEALNVLEMAKDPENHPFDGLVADYSDDPSWTENGGTITFYRGEMIEAFDEAAFAMENGEISDLVESEYGFHIIRKIDHIYPDESQVQTVRDYEENLISDYADSQKQAGYDSLFTEWEANYTLEIDENLWASVKTRYENLLETAASSQSEE